MNEAAIMETATSDVSPTDEVVYDPEQLEAITKCCDCSLRFWPVTGPAGSGKTKLIQEVYRRLTANGRIVAIAAPTGKAAKRIQEATGLNAVTVHRLLDYTHPGDRDPKTGKYYGVSQPRRHQDDPLDCDVVLIDEYAMLNQELHRNLVLALPAGGCIRAFGDIEQLQPIEKAEVFKDRPSPFRVALEKFKGTTLKTIHRQGEGSGIVINARGILDKRIPVRRDDFDMIITDNPVAKLEELVKRSTDAGISYSSLDNQIITPIKKSWVGIEALNALIQRIYFPNARAEGYRLDRHTWEKEAQLFITVGDKVVNNENNYDLEFFNGEVGIVTEITEFGEVVINDGTRTIVVPPVQSYMVPKGRNADGTEKTEERSFNPQKNLSLAYALTTHKCQGSEYLHVIYVLNKSSSALQCRPNFYTAVTRSRRRVTVIADQKSLYNSTTSARPWIETIRRK